MFGCNYIHVEIQVFTRSNVILLNVCTFMLIIFIYYYNYKVILYFYSYNLIYYIIKYLEYVSKTYFSSLATFDITMKVTIIRTHTLYNFIVCWSIGQFDNHMLTVLLYNIFLSQSSNHYTHLNERVFLKLQFAELPYEMNSIASIYICYGSLPVEYV